MTIPSSTLITHDTSFVQAAGIGRATVYGTVAAALTLNHDNEDRWWKLWQATWPSREDFESSMPLCWPPAEQDLLPSGAKALLQHQRKKYERDVKSVKGKIPDTLSEEWYRYYWLIVNTRCFFWEYFKKAKDLKAYVACRICEAGTGTL